MPSTYRDEPNFFMIWSPEGRAPTVKHATFEAAEIEARRLAKLASGSSFYILMAVAHAKVRDPVEVTRLATDDEIPF